jgi:hypothetical protein
MEMFGCDVVVVVIVIAVDVIDVADDNSLGADSNLAFKETSSGRKRLSFKRGRFFELSSR